MALFFYVTYLVHPEYHNRFVDIYKEGAHSAKVVFTMWAGIYCYYIFRLFKNEDEKLFSTLKALAIVILLFEIWGFADHNEGYGYDMGFGYRMEMAAIIFLAQYLNNKRNTRYLVLSLACMAFAILYGSRASIVGYGVFILVYFIWSKQINRRMVFLSVLVIITGVLATSQSFIMYIYNMFSGLGIESRTLYKIAVLGNISASTSRTERIWPVLIEALKEMPIYEMYGAFGDRTLLAARYPYAHNFILEILMTFGWIVGLAILVWIFVMFIKVIKNDKGLSGLITIIVGCFALCRLFFSSSFWVEPYFWALLAMLVNYSQNNRRNRANIYQGSEI
jgi:O-antigen ligase